MNQEKKMNRMNDDTISRQAAIDALWKALYEYEDKTEKQFIESDELDVEDWVQHRIFVQNMNDIDRQTILDLPSAQPEVIHCNSCKYWTQSTGKMKGYGLGRCDFHDADLVTCNGFCYWAERRNDG